MYHAIVRMQLRRAFAAINRAEYAGIVAQFAPAHRHVMFGIHGLGGERNTPLSTANWYGRLQRLMPELQFEIGAVAVAGWPWRTIAFVGWKDRFTLPDGSPGTNQGVHEFELRWGRVTALTVHCDTGRLERYAHQMSLAGLSEATAHPITDVT